MVSKSWTFDSDIIYIVSLDLNDVGVKSINSILRTKKFIKLRKNLYLALHYLQYIDIIRM